jgi:hypothetical protein
MMRTNTSIRYLFSITGLGNVAVTWESGVLLRREMGPCCIVRYPTVMIYSIALLEQSNFETIGWLMPTRTGIDNFVAGADAATTTQNKKKRKKHGSYNNKKNINNCPNNNNAMLQVLQSGTQTESQLSHFI